MHCSPAPRLLLVACAVAAAFLPANASYAQSGTGVGGSIGVTSDYVYRGISQTLGNPALQADLHYRSRNGWTLGVWGSRADLADDQAAAAVEVDLYISRDWTLDADWEVRTTLTHYSYAQDPRQSDYEYDELITSLGYRSRLFATVAWSPNTTRYSRGWLASNDTALSYEFAAVQPLFRQLSASAGIGYYDLPAVLDADYWFWNVGLACSLGHAQVTFSYIDTDDNAGRAFGYQTTGQRWAGSVAWRF